MFESLLSLAKNIVTLPVAAAVDVVNIVTFADITNDNVESRTETNLRKISKDTKNVIDNILGN